MMPVSLYQDIVKTIHTHRPLRQCKEVLENKYPTVSPMTLGSILSNQVQRRMKVMHSRQNNPDNIQRLYRKYQEMMKRENKQSGVLLKISDEIGITPVLTARFILEGYLRNIKKETERKAKAARVGQGASASTPEEDKGQERKEFPYNLGNIRSEVSRLLKNTTLIQDKELAYEVYLCSVQDAHYGPCPDIIKRTVGREHELILRSKLDELNVSYFDEQELRIQGYDKTPDFKLDVPIGIDGRVINWIESKATFGDEDTHKQYLEDQLISYYNRFGPGVVIYWLGYLESLPDITLKGIMIKDQMPSDITLFEPLKLSKVDFDFD